MKNVYVPSVSGHLSKFSTLILVVLIMLISKMSLGQVATDGDYRTRATGNWSGASTWQVRSSGTWSNTSIAPGSVNNIYIQNNHTLTIDVSTADCKDLHVNSLSGSNGVVSIGANTLQVSGKLRAYTGTVVISGVDGTFYSSQGSSSSPLDGMLSTTGAGLLKFIGATRNITNTNEWSNTGGINHSTEFALNAGATGTCQTGYKSKSILISSGTIDMTLAISRLAPDNGTIGQGDCTIQSGATLISANSGAAGNSVMSRTGTAASGRAGTFNLNGKLVLSGTSPEIQFTTINIGSNSTIEYSRGSAQSFVTSSFTGAAAIGSIYANVIFSGSGSKTPAGNFSVSKDLTLSGSAVLPLSALTITVGGNWTSYGTAGLTESSGTVDFNGAGAQVINTTGGEDFFKVKKSGSGTLTLNSDVRFAGASSDLNISSGILDAGTNTLSGTASTTLTMGGGTLKLAKTGATTLPEFPTTANYILSGGTIELNGAGNQTLRGGSIAYQSLTFSNSGTKGVTSAPASITGTITVANTAILDVANNNMGGAGTNLAMTGASVYKTAGSSQVKPDATGTYSLGIGTTIEFTNNAAGLESIRLTASAVTVNYYNIIVSGSAVGTTSLGIGIKFQSGGTFTVKNAAVFKLENSNGFSGAANTSIDNTNTPTIVLEAGSMIEYNGTAQAITNQTINTPSDANYEGLTLSNSGTKTAPATTLTVKGGLTKSGTALFAHNNGMVVLNGTATQAYNSTSPVMDFYNLTDNNTVDLTINNDLTVINELAFAANSKLNLEDGNITLRSDASNTANVGIIPSTASISYSAAGRFIVERYIPTGISHSKSWQFLSAPAVGQTIKESWMENGLITSTPNGYGTWITGPGTGFDAVTPIPSMKVYTPGTNAWNTVADPSVTVLNNTEGYMLFVRGDRSVFNFSGANSAAVPTTLRVKGTLLTGTQSPKTVIAGEFGSVANPYASAIDLTQLTLNESGGGVQDIFYVWDPSLGGSYGFGAYQTLTRNGTTYDVSPGGGSYGATNKLIQSGQAFFANAPITTGTLRFTEACKVGGSSIVTRPVNNIVTAKQLRTNLYVVKNNQPILIDGNRVQFDASYSNNIDILDAIKLSNTGEDLALHKKNKNLAVERRALIQTTDTIFYRSNKLRANNYRLEFIPAEIARPGLHAFLEDNFLRTRTAIGLDGATTVSFTVNNNPGSYAPNRFRLVFKQKHVHENNPGLKAEQGQLDISVYPNPVEGKMIRIAFNDQPTGKYQVQLISQSGQLIREETMNISEGHDTRSFKVPPAVSGNYQLIIASSTGNKTILQVIIK